ncbi:MAG: SGNH/GDSL hydrolase family protein [Cytophagales bacterium]|jgi:endoglucanase|nr:SGNH/GDSL hydrolase family protein [Cytophagales bacterium]
MRNLYSTVFLFLLCTHISYAQQTFFGQGDRVCFVGNSITTGGDFHHNILLYYVTRFPGRQVRFFNAGVPGDVTEGILNRLESDILIHRPTHAVIMIGMNDVNRNLYGPKATTSVDTLQKREAAIARYKVQLDSIVRLFLSKNIRVILQKPTIYDQTAVLKTPNHFGVNDALKQCADYVHQLADKYQLLTIDYWTILQTVNTQLQAKDPSATIISQDRVHPAAPGHLVMAYQFLKTTQMPKQVSRIHIAETFKETKRLSQNCSIQSFSVKSGVCKMHVKENALPFPILPAQQQGAALVPFAADFNQEIIEMTTLRPGKYRLRIDSVLVGVFSHVQLKAGVNLTDFQHTPQYRQALQVQAILSDLWKMESKLRTLKLVEYGLLKTFEKKDDFGAVKLHLEELIRTRYPAGDWFAGQLKTYIETKPQEHYLTEQSEVLRQRAYQAAQPKEHLFVIEPEKK